MLIDNIDYQSNNYKEEFPINTVNKFKRVMNDLGLVIEEEIQDSGVGTYWVRLIGKYKGCMVVHSGGKGSTIELALASAYGEMMEYLQTNDNGIYKSTVDLYNDVRNTTDYVLHPSEKKEYNVDKYLQEDKHIHKLKSSIHNESIKENYINEYTRQIQETYGYVPLAKYQKYDGTEETYLNEILIKNIIFTTGNSAGNSKYEALIQGLSEIIERYVKYKAFKDNLCFPLIPEEVIREYEYAYRMYSQINNNSRYKLELRDASLGGKFPVVVAILYDRVKRGYTVDFGCFPVFKIALERTLNELFQFFNIDNIGTLYSYTCNETLLRFYDVTKGSLRLEHNLLGTEFNDFIISTIDNTSNYKDKFIGDIYDFEYTQWGEITECNKELYFNTCNKLKENMGYEVYYRDCSFLGIPAYISYCDDLCIIPNLDMMGDYDIKVCNRKAVEQYIFRKEISTENFLKELNYKFGNLGVNILAREPKYGSYQYIIAGLVEYLKKDYSKSSVYFRQFVLKLNSIELGNSYSNILDTFKCLYNYIGLMETHDGESVVNILNKMFDMQLVRYIHNSCMTEQSLIEELFLNRYGRLCIIDWYMHEHQVEFYNKLHELKKNYI